MIKSLRSLLFLAAMAMVVSLGAQETFPRNGVKDQREGLYAFTNATIFTQYNQKIDKGTLLIRNGKVEAVGATVAIPRNAVVIDLKGKYIYPSFIDLYTAYGMPERRQEGGPTAGRGFFGAQQSTSSKEGAYSWNEALKTEFRAQEAFKADDRSAKEFRDLGFGAVLTHQMDGISRGTSSLVTLGSGREHELIVKETGAHHLSFNKGTSRQSYPSSLMGAIALLRQTYYDGQWYKNQQEQVNLSLEAWNAVQALPQIFEVRDRLEALRAANVGKEFGVKYIIMGSGDEYQRLEELKAAGSSFILPLNFPDAYDVEDPFDAAQITLAQLKHWELAPTNPARFATAGIDFALTTQGLRKRSDFSKNLRKAIENGLTEEQALKALTYTPANMMGAGDRLGQLGKGTIANFIITSGNVFDEKTRVYHNWINGKPFVMQDLDTPDWIGEYALNAGDQSYRLKVSGNGEKPDMQIVVNDSTSLKVQYTHDDGALTLSFEPEKGKGKVRLSGMMEGRNWSGRGQDAAGNWVSWRATYQNEVSDEQKRERSRPTPAEEMGPVTFPFEAFGWTERPRQGLYLIKNATVWTNEKEGILPNADVLIRDGKIAQVGKNLNARGATVIDGTGKHVTPGVIDEHSHIAGSRGINEGSQASSAEVRIGDILNSEDINIYRQLSGGVTTSQILHGSANPIGGQSAIIKLRWGLAPEQLKFENADGFIKFALGENVKQSGSQTSSRYPRTRMGVEQVYEDYFTEARKYGELKRSGKPYRKDLELEALLEILESKRFITCHSYVQSEINMLMKLAERFGFRVNTFTHILEGYKVADQMAKHGVGGSSFSDWWAYKYEVAEAIPYNGALMHAQGVTVAFNSDDAEMARRLNQEAGKAVLFGGVSEEDALKFVTLNPAKLLHIDNRVGSIKVGKDADVVLWSDHPLSVYAKAEKTFVDGIVYFDRETDMAMREQISKERNRIIQKMLTAKQGGNATQPARGRPQFKMYHCDDEWEEIRD